MNASLKLQQIKNIFYRRERNCLKVSQEISSVVYLPVILFRMRERDTATEKDLIH